MTDDSRSVQRYALIGIGCRFPGAVRSPADYWRLIAQGRDAVAPIPSERRAFHEIFDEDRAAAGKIYTRLGGFLDDVENFDASFFNISPREAARMDPQQRLLLEVVWEAFEDARLPLLSLAGSNTGVFVGISTHDYADMQMWPQHRESIDAHSNTGGATSIAANRLSYVYDLRGPSVAVDTACSSSLTAVHLACRALDAGDCDIAVVGGVQLLIRPELSVGFCRATMLSPEGHCKAFDAAADGYVRGEGAGALVLKPLERALAHGDPVRAVILASAVNQDGHSAGLTVPSEAAQRSMLRTALQRAGVAPHAVAYVEAHGTGTAVGDPIEARAIGSVFAQGRAKNSPLLLGSIKANIGHLEAASGVAGLIKAALMVERRAIPPLLHFHNWNPAIDAEALNLRAPTTLENWPESTEPPTAAVNSFGFGGANACVIVQAAPPRDIDSARVSETAQILTLSARSDDALRAAARSVAASLREESAALEAMCAAAARGRSALPRRLAVVGASAGNVADGIDSFLAGENRPGVATGRAEATGKLAFVFSGMGPQWWAMGRELLTHEPLFRKTMEACDASLKPCSGWSLIDEFRKDETHSRLAHPQLAQVTNFALQISLAELWNAYGIAPSAALGHSGGAMAAAYIAGVHSLDDSLRLCFHRSRLQGRDANAGRMLAVGLPPQDAPGVVEGYEDRVSVGAINGPNAFTLSGDGDALEKISQELTARRVFARMLTVTIAYHSPLMEPIRDEFMQAMAGLEGLEESLPFVSDTTGAWQNGEACDADYWWRAIRGSVRFSESMFTLLDAGFTRFVEIGPHPVLASSMAECAAARGVEALIVPSLKRKEAERTEMLRSLARLHVNGVDANWRALYKRDSRAPLPLYAWRKERHWFEPEAEAGADESGAVNAHPLLARKLSVASGVWQTRLSGARVAWIDDHLVQGGVVFPGAAYVEALRAAAAELDGKNRVALRDIEFRKALLLAKRDAMRLQTVFAPERRRIDIFAAPRGAENWTLHATARIVGASEPPPDVDIAALRSHYCIPLDAASAYERFYARGLQYGPAFRAIAQIARAAQEDNAVFAQIGPVAGLDAEAYGLHPALLDAAFQLLIVAVEQAGDSDTEHAFLPVRIDDCRFYRAAGATFFALCRLVSRSDDAAVGSFELFDAEGAPIASIRGLRARRMDEARRNDALDDLLYEERWELRPLGASTAPLARDALLASTPADFSARLARTITQLSAAHQWGAYYRRAEPALTAAAARVTLDALAELGYDASPGAVLGVAATDALKASDPSQGKWTQRLIALLVAGGAAEPCAQGYRFLPARGLADVAADFPAYETDFSLLAAAGRTLAAALAGERMDALVTAETLPLFTRFYESAPASAFYNALLCEALAPLIATARDRGAPLRILEVGAGSGGATRALLRLLPEDAAYCFTDSAGALLDAARDAFKDESRVAVRPLDISRDPLAQDFRAAVFDLIIAANVVHATPEIAATLHHLRILLAPRGALALLEITRDPLWLDPIFGQNRGWWAFADKALRSERPLLDALRWRGALTEAGFDDIWISQEQDAPGESAQSVMIARAPRREIALAPLLLISAYAKETGQRVERLLQALGLRVEHLCDPHPQSLRERLSRDEARTLCGVIFLCGAPPFAGAAAGAILEAPLAALQALPRDAATPLWFVTCGAARLAGDSDNDPAQAMLWGFARSAMRERVDMTLRLIDIGAAPNERVLRALLREITEADSEDEIALRDDARFVHRLRRISAAELPTRIAGSADADANWRVEIGTRGALSSLRLSYAKEPAPGPDDIVIDMRAASLNYRDVMLAMGGIQGLEDEMSFGRRQLGSDGAGVVRACGENVRAFKPGDRVMAVAAGALSRRVATRAALAAPLPEALDFAEGASLPTAWLTAWLALKKIARLEKGERILIHSATGGVGLAAIQIARAAGAIIFATAGNDAKRAYLAALGVDHIMDSRSLDFADEIRARTQGAGVHVVLNSLAGEAIERGIDCLAPYGRFLEIGKRDIYAGAALDLSPFRRNLSYVAIDLDRYCNERPEAVGDMLRELAVEFAQKRLTPPPIERFALRNVEGAFRQMTQARHIGKIVIDEFEDRPPIDANGFRPRADASYLISGGLGGFGLAVAEWLAQKGAGGLALVSRGAPNVQAEKRLAALRARGTHIAVFAADVRNLAQMQNVVAEIDRHLLPLAGVFHAAMALDDRRLEELDRASLDAAIGPKSVGALNLHLATLSLPLDCFVMFSSIAAAIGNPMQANYAAGNACLNALAEQRRSLGLPALAIDWGVLAQTGYVAARPELKDFLDSQGFRAFSTERALAVLDALCASDATRIMAADVDWRRLAAASPRAVASPRLAGLVPKEEAAAHAGLQAALLRDVAALPAGERVALITAHLAGFVARILGAAAQSIEADKPLDAMGFDSLLAVEFATALTTHFNFETPVLELLGGMTLERLANRIAARIESAPPAPTVPPQDAQSEPQRVASAAQTQPVQAATTPALAPGLAPDLALAPAPDRWTPMQRVAQTICKFGLSAIGRIDVAGLEHLPPRGACILAVNHLSMADTPLAFALLPRRATVIANARLKKNPFLAFALGDIGGAIFLQKGEDAEEALEAALAVLAQGGVVALSPEGTRSKAGLIRGSTGVAFLAARAQAPVVPYVAWGQEAWRTRFRRPSRIPVTVRLGAPLAPPTEQLSAEMLRDYTDEVMDALAELLPPAYRGVYGKTGAV